MIQKEARNAKLLDASINQFPSKNRDPTPGWSKISSIKVVNNKTADVYARSRMNFGSDTVLSKNPNFMNFGLSPVNTADKLGSVIIPKTRVGRPTNVSDWLHHGHDISGYTADGVNKMKAKSAIILKIILKL